MKKRKHAKLKKKIQNEIIAQILSVSTALHF